MNNNNQQNFFMGALFGSLAGATAMLLFTPLSGERIRNKLMQGINFKSVSQRKHPSRTIRASNHRTSSRNTERKAKSTSKRRSTRAKSSHHVESRETASV